MGDVTAAVLAIDGGNSKTDVCLLSTEGRLLGYARGPGSNHQVIGVDAAFDVLAGLVGEAAAEAGIDARSTLAQHAAVYLAGADFPREREMLLGRVSPAGWAAEVSLDNDTFALLRAGTSSPDRIAVVCGAGINCVGVSAAGEVLRFPSVGAISGDWGGGATLGTEALFHAVRAEDGRGQPTALREAIMDHFGTPSVVDVTAALHFGELPRSRLHELVPLLFRVAAAGDGPARGVVERLAQEVFLTRPGCPRSAQAARSANRCGARWQHPCCATSPADSGRVAASGGTRAPRQRARSGRPPGGRRCTFGFGRARRRARRGERGPNSASRPHSYQSRLDASGYLNARCHRWGFSRMGRAKIHIRVR